MTTYPIDPQLTRWFATHVWHPGWLMECVSRRHSTAPTSSPPHAVPDHRSFAGAAALASSGPRAEPKMPDWWADVPLPVKAAYWHVRLLGGDPLVLVEMAYALGSRASANHLVDEDAAEATTVANSVALPELVPVVVQRRQGRLTTEHRGSGDSERAARRGRRRGPAWEIAQQLVDDLVAGIVDMHAPRPVIATHARVLLAARGFDFDVDYSRPALDSVVRAAVATAMARIRTRA